MEILARIEALLFVSAGPISIQQLASALEISARELEQAIQQLDAQYQDRGLRLQKSTAGYQLVSAPEAAKDIERFLGLEEITQLSRAGLEVLAIIAYQQPITRPLVDSVRGVNSDSVLRTLLRHGLIEEVGRSEGPGRPFLYTTTTDFLSYFGLGSLQDLPPLQIDSEGALSQKPDPEIHREVATLDE
ncbi:MAG: SMC-Scp complex subunit ScpB [Anaerolineales bacterium]|nr:MAG: SMC-Scp complex subunit ScpB [Anaerolineales bacterium]